MKFFKKNQKNGEKTIEKIRKLKINNEKKKKKKKKKKKGKKKKKKRKK